MTYRETPFRPGEVYHVYTRGVEKRELFGDDRDRKRLFALLSHCRPAGPIQSFSLAHRSRPPRAPKRPVASQQKRAPLVELLCFCFMPNHLHLLLREIVENGTSLYMQRLLNSYAKYFNLRNGRSGPLFAGPFRSAHIGTDELLLHVSRYIHLNPFVAGLVAHPLAKYQWSSLAEYITPNADGICDTELIRAMMDAKNYRTFVLDHADYARSLGTIKHLFSTDQEGILRRPRARG